MSPLGFYDNTLCVFLHGFGNSPSEMERLQCHCKSMGVDTVLATLPFHETQEEFSEFEAEAFVERLGRMLSETAKGTDKKIVVISTSLSSLALELCEDLPKIEAHLAISPFLGLRSDRAKCLSAWPRMLDKFHFRRRPDAQAPWLPNDLFLSGHFTFGAVRQLEELAQKARFCPKKDYPKTLVIHSHEDTVACYSKSIRYYSQQAHCVEFISLFGIAHIAAPNLLPNAVFELIEHTLCTASQEADRALVTQVYSEISQENRAWADKIFSLVAGFMTVFGVLIFNTFPELSTTSKYFPFVLLSYSSVTFIYVLIASLYFYYLNRSQHYLQSFIEPLMGLPGYIDFKLNPHISGSASRSMTQSASIPLVVIPTLIGIVSLVYVIIERTEFISSGNNSVVLLATWATANAILLVATLKNLQRLASHTKHALYSQRAPQSRSIAASLAIAKLVSR